MTNPIQTVPRFNFDGGSFVRVEHPEDQLVESAKLMFSMGHADPKAHQAPMVMTERNGNAYLVNSETRIAELEMSREVALRILECSEGDYLASLQEWPHEIHTGHGTI